MDFIRQQLSNKTILKIYGILFRGDTGNGV